jgi:DNA-binding response OmpR family regulator
MISPRTFRILILGDPLFHAEWAVHFRNDHTEIQHFNTLQEAGSFLTQHSVDLTLFDSRKYSPQQELSICAQIRAKIKTPFLLLTAFENEDHLVAAYQHGIDDFLIQPVSPSLLMAKLIAWSRWSTFPDNSIITSILEELAPIPPKSRSN